MSKILNFRPLFIILLCISAGILSAGYFTYKNADDSFIIAIIIDIVLFISLFIFKKGFFKFVLKHKSWVLTFILAVFIGSFSFYNFYCNYPNYQGEVYTISGTTTDIATEYSEGTLAVVISNVKIDSKKVTGKMYVNIYNINSMNDFKAGTNIKFEEQVYSYSLLDDGEITTQFYKDGLYYYSYTNAEDCIITVGSSSFAQSFRLKIKEILYDNLSEENAGIAYAVLFGDTSGISDATDNAFQVVGVAHILAVSGLNIAFILIILIPLFSLLKVRKIYKVLISSIFILVYAYLCSFSPSVMRASVMAIILLLSSLFGSEYDPLSSLSMSGLVILTFAPMYLFDVGFLLSFTSVFGIIVLYSPIKKLLTMIKLPDNIASAIAVTLAAQVGIFPVMAHYFNTFSVLSVLANLIIVPVFSLIFMFTFIVSILALLVSFLGQTLMLTQILLNFCRYVTVLMAQIPFMSIVVYSLGVLVVAYYAILFVYKYVMIAPKIKTFIMLGFALIFIIAVIISYLPAKFDENTLRLLAIDGENYSIVTTEEGQVYFIDNTYGKFADDIDNIKQELLDRKIKTIDAIIISGLIESELSIINNFAESVNAETVLIPEIDFVQSAQTILYGKLVYLTREDLFNKPSYKSGITLYSYYDNDTLCGITVQSKYQNILFVNHECTITQITFIYNSINFDVDVICTKKITTAILSKFSTVNYYVVNETCIQYEEENNIYDYTTLGRFTLLLNFDRIILQH
ncbi:MAG: ComEC/Rec2 family competence protein [Clostridia bacterium]|nr:ComEC/Rec2 family competence protein [Clostridia bacterium]